VSFSIIDTHQHLWDPETFRYSWMDGFPAIKRRAMIEEYRAATDGLHIGQTVYVDTDVDETDLGREIAAIFSLADDPVNRIGGIVAGAKLEKPEPFAHLAKWLLHPKLKGIRRVLHTQPDELSREPRFRENMREVERRAWSFDLCVLPRQLPLARDLVGSFPGVTFILDHCGGPDIKGRALDPWRRDLQDLSAQSNVVCKVSGLITCADPRNWSVEDLRPFFEHVVACFGWDRLLWGGDWPVCNLNASLKDWLDAAKTLTARATEEQRAKFFEGNARRIYRLA